jgi:hypothetical protein
MKRRQDSPGKVTVLPGEGALSSITRRESRDSFSPQLPKASEVYGRRGVAQSSEAAAPFGEIEATWADCGASTGCAAL